jgi:hypothetical protein
MQDGGGQLQRRGEYERKRRCVALSVANEPCFLLISLPYAQAVCFSCCHPRGAFLAH